MVLEVFFFNNFIVTNSQFTYSSKLQDIAVQMNPFLQHQLLILLIFLVLTVLVPQYQEVLSAFYIF